MNHTLSVLLCLGLCLVQRMRTQADTLPKAFLRAENGSLVPVGGSVTLRCQGSLEADKYYLVKLEGSQKEQATDEKSDKSEVEFLISSVTRDDAGSYYCQYKHSSGWSAYSDALQLVVAGLYPPPSLSFLPSPEVASGHDVTLRCQSQQRYHRIALYKDGEKIHDKDSMAQPDGSGYWADFLIPAVSTIHGGTYRCYSFNSNYPHVWSSPSEPLVLRVTGTSSPSPESENTPNGLSHHYAGILMGVSAFLVLIFLFLLLLLCHRCCHHQTRLGNGDREAEVKKTARSSDPAGSTQEETLHMAVNDDRQTEEDRQEDTAAPTSEDPREVTYAQLNLNRLNARAQDPPLFGSVEPSRYDAMH